MQFIPCACVYESFADEPGSIWTTLLEFVFSVFIVVCGVMANLNLLKKLHEERQNTPVSRKGNVIEPIMSLFGWIQVIYWPVYLLLLWIQFNQIVPSTYMNGWWCSILLQLGIQLGRLIIACNSLFVALIRYFYIVYPQKSNQWEFKRVGNIFRICSLAIPTVLHLLHQFVNNYGFWQNQPNYRKCVASFQGLNITDDIQFPKAVLVEWTTQFIPESIVIILNIAFSVIESIVLLNLLEGLLYFRMFRCVKR